MTPERSIYLSRARRIVIKIGSSLLTGDKKHGVKNSFLARLAGQINILKSRGVQCLIVTSGAISAGMFELGLKKRPEEMSELQALAAVGQSNLMHAYKKNFDRYKIKVAQVLLTREDLSQRHRYANAHRTLMKLFQHGIVPVVNENDTVAVEEIKFGNNDTLGVLVTHLAEADLLIILTDTDGFFSEDPRLNPKAKLISNVFQFDHGFEKMATRSNSIIGTGGMKSKILAAKNMMRSGVPMLIANGTAHNALRRLLDSEPIGTFFFPTAKKMKSRKRWLAWGGIPKGEIFIDDGAQKALLEKNKSLLPTGVRKTVGSWHAGEMVKIVGSNHREIANGICNFSATELNQIMGLKTSDLFDRIGRETSGEVVHRDNMVKIEID
jgi:glutamate 5-kinase